MTRQGKPRVAIIGAGVAGLAAARTLRSSHDVVVFDKGRGPGGRTSSRRAEPFSFDHGAQYFTARQEAFRRPLDAWIEEGIVAPWSGRIVAVREGVVTPARGETERFVGVPGMNALAKRLARDVEVRASVRVTGLDWAKRSWKLTGSDGSALGEFEQLVVTAPPAQAAALIGAASPLGARAAEIRMRPCWALLLGLEERYAVPFDGAFCESSAISWISRNNSKPGRPDAEAWVVHSAPDWTEAHLEHSAESASELLMAELERATGVPVPAIVHRDAHLWRYALPDSKLEVQSLYDAERGLVLAGDAYAGGRVEGAFLSGISAAEKIT